MADNPIFRARRASWLVRGIGTLIALYVGIVLALMWWWSYESAQFDVVKFAQARAAAHQQQVVVGSVVTGALAATASS